MTEENINHSVKDVVELGLSDDPEYGDISNYPHLDKLSFELAVVLSLGLGTNTMFGDVSNIPDYWKLSKEMAVVHSSANSTYTGIAVNNC